VKKFAVIDLTSSTSLLGFREPRAERGSTLVELALPRTLGLPTEFFHSFASVGDKEGILVRSLQKPAATSLQWKTFSSSVVPPRGMDGPLEIALALDKRQRR
jgi:hypothetical protein